MEYNFGDIRVICTATGAKLITSVERATCPFCGLPDCCFNCDESQESGDEEEVASRLAYNGGLDGIEALILAHAASGAISDIGHYDNGVQTALEGLANNL